MQRVFGSLFIATALLVSVTSCRQPIVKGSGPTKSEDRQTTGTFSQIEIDAPVDADIQVVAGSTPSVNLSGYANVLPYIKIKVEDGKLKIYTQDEINLYTQKKIVAHIILPSLAGLDIAGSSDTKVAGNVTGNELKVDIAGAGTIKIDSLNVSMLDVDMAGSSEIDILSGNTGTASYSIAGSGDINAYNLQTTNTNIEIAGSGDAKVNAVSKLDVSISGSGDVLYKGTPAVEKDIAGSGSVDQAK